MKTDPFEPFSVRKLADAFGVTHPTLLAALKRSGVRTGRGVKITIKQAHDALTKRSDNHGDMASERLRKLRAEARCAELKAMRLDGSVIATHDSEAAGAIALGTLDRCMRQALTNDLPAVLRGLDEAGIRRKHEEALESAYTEARKAFAEEVEKAKKSIADDEEDKQ